MGAHSSAETHDAAIQSAKPSRVEITLVNHASVLTRVPGEGVMLLTDPWYSGYAFEGGWGLKYDNPSALELAASATHMWISHFHEDHMHVPTLRKLFEVNPEIIFLANQSYNFDIGGVAKRVGFKNIIAFGERTPVRLSDGVEVTRYPTTGIDNMLLIKGRDWTILNYNDCVISHFSQRLLARKLGPIDIFMSNFNHAGKLLHHKKTNAERVKGMLVENFKRNFGPFHPKYVIPFASHHYYRAPESSQQNASLITVAELKDVDPRVVPLHIGDRFEYEPGSAQPAHITTECRVTVNPESEIERTKTVPYDELCAAGQSYAKKIQSGFGVLTRAVPSLRIRIADLDRVVTLRLAQGVSAEENGGGKSNSAGHADIECHSSMAHVWFTKQYGTDALAVGAHFGILSARKRPLVAHIAVGMLVENKLDVKSILSMLTSMRGVRFLTNRREEIAGILLFRKVYADYHNE
jgi:hypothetical protein